MRLLPGTVPNVVALTNISCTSFTLIWRCLYEVRTPHGKQSATAVIFFKCSAFLYSHKTELLRISFGSSFCAASKLKSFLQILYSNKYHLTRMHAFHNLKTKLHDACVTITSLCSRNAYLHQNVMNSPFLC